MAVRDSSITYCQPKTQRRSCHRTQCHRRTIGWRARRRSKEEGKEEEDAAGESRPRSSKPAGSPDQQSTWYARSIDGSSGTNTPADARIRAGSRTAVQDVVISISRPCAKRHISANRITLVAIEQTSSILAPVTSFSSRCQYAEEALHKSRSSHQEGTFCKVTLKQQQYRRILQFSTM